MNFSQFSHTSAAFWNEYLATIQSAVLSGQTSTTVTDGVPSFPQSLVVTSLPDHFAMELVGGRSSHRPLRVLKRTLDDPDLYFGQFTQTSGAPAMVNIVEGSNQVLSTLALVTPNTQTELDRRFPGVSDLFLSRLVFVMAEPVIALRVGPNADFVTLEHVLLANSWSGLVRIRHINLVILIKKSTTISDWKQYLTDSYSVTDHVDIHGMQMLPRGVVRSTHLAAQFANLFLMDRLHETSLGTFIEQHREILLKALHATDLIPHPLLEWQVISRDPEEHSIIPDLLLQRPDGFWDIWDLKLPLLGRRDLTTGARNRRRFVNPIEDGIAQLAHYRQFLEVPENRTHLEEKYGAKLSEPRYGLIVGNYENVDANRIAEASRRLDHFEMIDYDSILQLYLAEEGFFQHT
jgi:hypothetical protein